MDIKILIIDESELLRNFLKELINKSGIEIILAKDGVDGLIKMRNHMPNLIIMDYYIPRLSGISFLKEKEELKTTKEIPIILLSSKIDQDEIIAISKYKIVKILYKPIEVDILINNIIDLFKIDIKIDTTPCIFDVHLNDEILFIEVAQGLNKDKIKLLKYKIFEIMNLFETEINKILIIFTDIINPNAVIDKIDIFMFNIIQTTNVKLSNIVILTSTNFIKDIFINHHKYNTIKITDNFMKAIDHFDFLINNLEFETIKKRLISSSKIDKNEESQIQLAFSNEKISEKKDKTQIELKNKYIIAVIDDDLSILEFMENLLQQQDWNIHVYENGRIFISDLPKNKPDLIFLDLLMPTMNGFDVLKFFKENKINIPIIILSAVADKEYIIKAREFGVKSYITKPIKPMFIKHKADEILKSNF
jgi:DNA-binding response OmpR family regulator